MLTSSKLYYIYLYLLNEFIIENEQNVFMYCMLIKSATTVSFIYSILRMSNIKKKKIYENHIHKIKTKQSFCNSSKDLYISVHFIYLRLLPSRSTCSMCCTNTTSWFWINSNTLKSFKIDAVRLHENETHPFYDKKSYSGPSYTNKKHKTAVNPLSLYSSVQWILNSFRRSQRKSREKKEK